jgi:PAS domain S-box-containing protein
MPLKSSLGKKGELRDERDLASQIVHCIPELIWTMDMSGRFTYASPVVERTHGWTVEEFLKLTFRETHPPEQSAAIASIIEEELGKIGPGYDLNTARTIEVVEIRKDGSSFWAEVSARFLWDDAGKPVGIIGITRDISARKEMEEALRKSEAGLQAAQRIAHIGSWQWDVKTDTGVWSEETYRIFGVAPGPRQDHRKTFLGCVHPEDRGKVNQALSDALNGARDYDLEYRIVLPDGTGKVIHGIAETLRDKEGKVVLMRGTTHDITEAKRVEEALRKSEAQLRAILDQAPCGITIRALPAGQILLQNEQAERILGGTISRLDDIQDYKAFHLDGRPFQRGDYPLMRSAEMGEVIRGMEFKLRRQDGSWVIVSASTAPVRDAKGRTIAVLAVFDDITQRKRTEEQAMSALAYSKLLLENSPVGISTYRASGEAVSVNSAMARMSGATMELLTAQNFRHLESWKKSGFYDAAEEALRTGTVQHRELTHTSSFGKPMWVSAQFIPFTFQDAPYLLIIFVDIAEHKRAEAIQRESEEKFRQLAENINNVFWICNNDQTEMLYISPAYERIWGRSCQSLYERPRSFMDAIHPDDREEFIAALKKERNEEESEKEFRIIRPDGSVRWVSTRSFGVRNEKGEFYRRAGLAEDITERRELEAQFRQAQKMDAVGQLAGGVAHDFNNILSVMLMNLGLLDANPATTPEMKEGLKSVERGALLAANLTRQLLLFSRRQAAHFKPLEMNALIGGLLKMLQRLLPESIQIRFQSDGGDLWVQADTTMLEQVVMNLCINARDAMAEGGTLTLGATLVERDAQSAKTHPDAGPGRFTCLTVKDTGCGMDTTVIKRIFEPFFTTKGVGKGTGLGLATAYGIVKQHEGWIEVDSAPDCGSEFRVFLPAIAKPEHGNSPDPGAEAVDGGSETILLVEDDHALREVTGLCLRGFGYTILEAANGPEALKQWEEHAGEISLLITDMVMPEQMNGLELATKLKEAKPGLPVIICTGYSVDLLATRPLDPSILCMGKPFSPSALAKMARQCLDAIIKAKG